MSKRRVLFLYPNHGTELRIPLAISILISVLRKAGHEVKLFDTTFYGDFHTDNEAMAKLGTHKSTNLNDLVGETINADPKQALRKILQEFQPDFIFASIVERNFNAAKELLAEVEVPILLGGILPTIAPEFCLGQGWVDYICVGEGEKEIISFLENPKSILTPHELINMDDVPEQDWTDFDKRHLLKPFMGKVYRGGAFELSRGCYGDCTFCVAPRLRKTQQGLGKYHRTKSPLKAINEIERKVKDYDLEMVAFSDTDFLRGVDKKLMREFLQLYAERIRLPFTMQSSVGTLLDEETLKLLKKAKCCAISVGVESGSERIQKVVLKKPIPTDKIKTAFDLCRKNDLRVTANYMVGLPFETEEDVKETIKLNKMVNPPSIAVTYFTPFIGTELYDVCIKEGWYKPFNENVYEYPPLDMPQLPPNRIKELVKEFVDDFRTYQKDISL